MIATALIPAGERELAEQVAQAAAGGGRLCIAGGGSKADVGTPVQAGRLEAAALTGIVDYDPPELVLTVRPGTPLAEVEALVAGEEQMLAFEPFDHGPLFGREAGAATIGGVVAAGVAGSRRVSAGGARDHLLGLRAISGRGELFVGGAKVVKNVTGYDLPKLAAGSWGRLFAMTEITLKVLPRPRTSATCALFGLDPAAAVRAMAAAMGSTAEVAAAAHLPGDHDERATTLFRIEGFGPSVQARCAALATLLASFGPIDILDEASAAPMWTALRTLAPLVGDRPLWRVNVAPSRSPVVIDALAPHGADWLLDWAGGLVWIACESAPSIVRTAAAAAGGHATLVRAPQTMRAQVPALHPPAAGVAALEERVRRAFDPAGVFETGRF